MWAVRFTSSRFCLANTPSSRAARWLVTGRFTRYSPATLPSRSCRDDVDLIAYEVDRIAIEAQRRQPLNGAFAQAGDARWRVFSHTVEPSGEDASLPFWRCSG